MISHAWVSSTPCANNKHKMSLDWLRRQSDSQGMESLPFAAMGQRIQNVRKSRGFSQVALGEAIGVSQTNISSWERGRTECPRDMALRIANYFRVPLSDIEGAGNDRAEQLRFREVPIISWVSAGRLQDPGDLVNMAGERLMISDLPNGEYFAAEVKGDSMDRLSPEGSKLIVDASDKTPRPGKCYIFSLRGEATYKRFQSDPVVRLEPFSTNPANQTIYPKRDNDWAVIGRVVRSYIDLG